MQIQKKNISKINLFLIFFTIIYFYSEFIFSASCKDIFNFFYQNAGLKNILNKDIFKTYGSGGINIRNIVTTPIGLYYNGSDFLFNNISLNILYFDMPGGVVFGNGKNNFGAIVNSEPLVNLYNDHIINFLQNTPYSAINVPFLSNSFDYINIIEKKLGFMFNGAFELTGNLFLYFQLPLIYNIFYPSIPSELQSVISMEIAQLTFDKNLLSENLLSNNYKNSRDIIIEHTVYDTFGLDRSIFGFCKKWFDERLYTDVRVFFPGKDIFENNIGGNFSRAKNKIDSLNIKKILIDFINNVDPNTINFDSLKEKYLIGFDRLILGSYYSPFSYQGYGISPSFFCSIPCSYNFFVNGYFSLIYNFSQSRLGIGMDVYNNELDENIDFELLTPEKACEDLNIFSKALEKKIIPDICTGTFYTGNEYQLALSLRSLLVDMSLVLGLDLWYKEKSYFLPINPVSLSIQTLSSATQLNGFINFEYFTYCYSFPITISAMAQATIYAEGIGGEFGFKIQTVFQY